MFYADSPASLSRFHALFSIGGFTGSAFMTLLLSRHVTILHSTVLFACLMAAAMLFATPRLLQGSGKKEGSLFVLPRGLVLVITGILAGPAGIGFVAKTVGLPAAFWMLAGLLALVPIFANVVTANRQ